MGDERTALIVGGSDGIGLATARLLLDDGWHVRGISRREAPIDHPAYAHSVCDVTSEGYPELLRQQVGVVTVDVVIFCVGIGNDDPPEAGVGEVQTIDVNLVSAVRTLEVLLPRWVERGAGHFIGLSSLVDTLRIPDGASYCASKAGLSAYLECLGLHLRGRGVAITNVRFGFVDTKMARSDVKPFMITADRAARVLRRAIERRPLRVSRPWTAAVAARLFSAWNWLQVTFGSSRSEPTRGRRPSRDL